MAASHRLTNKVGAVFGFASHRSLAWSIADAWNREGATVCFGLQNERFRPALEKLVQGWERKPQIVLCDVQDDTNIDNAFKEISEKNGGKLDCLAHSIAFATQSAMKNPFLQCSRDDFRIAHEISAYSLIALTRGAHPLMKTAGGGSVMALSYIGAQRVVPAYKVMGAAKASLESTARYLAAELGSDKIRVNNISAGPIDTLAARGIPGFTTMRDDAAAQSPLQGGVKGTDVGNLAAFLASDDSSAITAQTLYVDCGYSSML